MLKQPKAMEDDAPINLFGCSLQSETLAFEYDANIEGGILSDEVG